MIACHELPTKCQPTRCSVDRSKARRRPLHQRRHTTAIWSIDRKHGTWPRRRVSRRGKGCGKGCGSRGGSWCRGRSRRTGPRAFAARFRWQPCGTPIILEVLMLKIFTWNISTGNERPASRRSSQSVTLRIHIAMQHVRNLSVTSRLACPSCPLYSDRLTKQTV